MFNYFYTSTKYQGNISSSFSRNHEVYVSEFLRYFENILPCVYMHTYMDGWMDIIYGRVKSRTTLHCVAHIQSVTTLP